MGRRPSKSRKRLVEDCAVLTATLGNLAVCHRLGIQVTGTMPKPFKSFREWFTCPRCGSRRFKLYQPDPSSSFACRHCHKLTYRSTQEHDARLGRFLKMSDDELESIIENGNDRERRLGLRARAYRPKAPQKVLAGSQPRRILDFDE